MKPLVIEHRLHELECEHCGGKTRVPLPEGLSAKSCGARLAAFVAFLRRATPIMLVSPIDRLNFSLLITSETVAVAAAADTSSFFVEPPPNQLDKRHSILTTPRDYR